jgi:SAM-dependent methyltransferase
VEQAEQLREGVRGAYSAAAERPGDRHPFPVGREFAWSLGYPADLLASLPAAAVEAFAGVSNVSMFAELATGARVLDLGCGAGLDSLIAARRVGPSGRVTGVDFGEAMLARARRAAAELGQSNVDFRSGEAEELPFPDRAFDAAIVNGIFNLNPARHSIFRELARVLQRGASVFAAELVLCEPPTPNDRASISDWFA